MSLPSRILAALLLCLVAGCSGCSGRSKSLEFRLGDNVVLRLVRLEPGRFQMGSTRSEQDAVQEATVDEKALAQRDKALDRPFAQRDWTSQEKQHDVEISKAFYIGVYEVTQGQYEAVVGRNPSYFSSTGGGKLLVEGEDTAWFPVDTVSWNDAMEFCRRLSEKQGRHFDLPTEAEWEYACRAGSTSMYAFGDTLSSRQANYFGVQQSTRPVGTFEANEFGLYDMHGNVAEWCKDWYDREYYSKSPKVDPQGPASGTFRVIRGGCCFNPTVFCRSAAREHDRPSRRGDRETGDMYGFRVVLRE